MEKLEDKYVTTVQGINRDQLILQCAVCEREYNFTFHGGCPDCMGKAV